MNTLLLRILGSISITLGMMGHGVFAQVNTPVGLWETINDETNEPESHVRIWVDDGALYGKIEKLNIDESGYNLSSAEATCGI